MRVRVKVILPATAELRAVGISLAAHAALVIAVFASTLTGRSAPPGPAINVSLAAAPAARTSAPVAPPRASPGPETARPPQEPTPRAPQPEPAPETKPSVRQRIDEPKRPDDTGDKPVARPEKLPEVEPEDEPATEPPATGGGGEGGTAPLGLPTGPIQGGVAGLATDQPFTADWFLQLVVARLQDAWRDRPILPAGSAPQRVVVAFTIARDGTVVDARIDTPSRYTPLDLSALRAVTSLGKLPALPRNYGENELGARFVFELRPAGR